MLSSLSAQACERAPTMTNAIPLSSVPCHGHYKMADAKTLTKAEVCCSNLVGMPSCLSTSDLRNRLNLQISRAALRSPCRCKRRPVTWSSQAHPSIPAATGVDVGAGYLWLSLDALSLVNHFACGVHAYCWFPSDGASLRTSTKDAALSPTEVILSCYGMDPTRSLLLMLQHMSHTRRVTTGHLRNLSWNCFTSLTSPTGSS